MPHESTVRVCPATGHTIEVASAKPASPRAVAPPSAVRSKDAADAADTGFQPLDVPKDMLGRTLGGRYVLRDVLGSGGMGTVFEAEHLGLKRTVAIKVLNPSQARKGTAVKRFQQEARAAGSIGHPNICEVYDLGALEDGSPYLVMEKLTGKTLAQRLQKELRIAPAEIVEILIQTLSGLGAAHDKGIVHRDIKPDNIFIAKRAGAFDIVKVVDFGVSKIFTRGDGEVENEDLDLTKTGMVMGTPYYMSPEQASGERSLDARVDIYACGVVMYEAVTGRRPYLAPNYNALLLKIISGKYKPAKEIIADLPAAFDAVIRRAMAISRNDRYPSASDMQRDLLALRASLAPRPVPPPRVQEEPVAIPAPPSTRKDGGGAHGPNSPAPLFAQAIGPAQAAATASPKPVPDLDETVAAGQRNRANKVTTAPIPVIPPPPSSDLDIPVSYSDSVTGPTLPRKPDEPRPNATAVEAARDAAARAAEWDDELPTEIYQPPPRATLPTVPNPTEARRPWPEEQDSNTTLRRPSTVFIEDEEDDLRTRRVPDDLLTPIDPRLDPRFRPPRR